ncbi:MAG: YgiQ family radical SAM protein [Oscillospiraceae bacterium]|nr:YgiQ family radical SAM protein [Oscillospiraceae bacterium]
MTVYDFLPVSREDMRNRDWYYYDFLLITGDAYVDHPSFGAAVIGRVLEAKGYRVAILPQPDYTNENEIKEMGRPRYAVLITAGNLDSMVAHYTAAKKPRSDDYYTPGKIAGKRPDRAVTVYSKLARSAFPDLPIIIGGLEASLRRFAHYDYWDDKVHPPILFTANADIVVYGMGETAIIEIAKRLSEKEDIKNLTDIRGTGYISDALPADETSSFGAVTCYSFEEVAKDRYAYACAAFTQHEEHDPVRGKAIIQPFGGKALIINPPAKTLSTKELDEIYDLPYTREVHPMYEEQGGVSAIDEVRFSIIHNRGCFGNCNFCALAFHQGRVVASRSHESVIAEAEKMTHHPEFKGYIHDVGGPTANFRRPSCKKQQGAGMCKTKSCLGASPCENLDTDHTDYLQLLRKLKAIKGIKKVFIRSGIRFDYLLLDKSGEFFAQLVKDHISGQLKVAPEHCVDTVLGYMGKPKNEIYEQFKEKYAKLNKRYEKDQYLVAYLLSSHPGSTLNDAIRLAEYLNKQGWQPEQVQDFYPTPGTISTCMYYTGLDPRTMKPIHVPKTKKEKTMGRALLQWKNPKNRSIIEAALKEAGREDLIGFKKHCLIRPKKTFFT